MALKYRCRFCLSLEDAKYATNLFTVDAKHANLLGLIFLVALTESDGLQSHVCRSCKRRAFTVEKLFILEHHFRFPYLTEDVQHGVLKRSLHGTDCYRSQLGCNVWSCNTDQITVVSDAPQKKWDACTCANSRYQGPGYEAMPWYVLGML